MASQFDKEIYNLTVSINKALNPLEAPLKIKHARSVIITTHRMKEVKSFWNVVTRQPLMENRFIAWKFCHLLHKVLREGHESALKQSQSHKKMILEMGKLWGHLQDGVGSCIQAYSKLLVTKLDFHEKNALFPGSLLMDFREIENAASEDINIYFQLCVEIFDYLDGIIDVQLRVFTSVNTYRMSSMTPQGQCRLAPLITLIQDTNPLYDLCVRIMFKLHDKLPNDILNGHRDRFRELFIKVKSFYDNVRPLQYFSDLIQVPHLPETAPNFASKIDFGSYIPPVMYVQPDPEPPMENLVDTDILHETPVVPNEKIPAELKDKEIILQLETELSSIKRTFTIMENNYEKELNQLREDLSTLSNELYHSKDMCRNVQSLKESLEQKIAEATTLREKTEEEEMKAKASEEKFSKLKAMYSQIRDEHINLLRQHGETTKILNREKEVNMEMGTQIEKLNTKINDLEKEETNRHEVLSHEKQELALQVEKVTNNYNCLLEAYEELKQDHTNLATSKGNEIEELTSMTHKLKKEVSELDQSKQKITRLEKSVDEITDTWNREKYEHTLTINNLKEELKTKTAEVVELKKFYEIEFGNKDVKIKKLQNQQQLIEMDLKESKSTVQKLIDEKTSLQSELQKLFELNKNLESKLEAADHEILSQISKQDESKIRHEKSILDLLKKIFETLEFISTSKVADLNYHCFEKTLKYALDLEQILKEISICYIQFGRNNNFTEELVRQSILLIYSFVMLHEQCLYIYSTSTDIDKGQAIFSQANNLYDDLTTLLQVISSKSEVEIVEKCISKLNFKLADLQNLVNELLKTLNNDTGLENLVENELAEMDKAIQDATEKFIQMLSNSRSKYDGIKLEVNGKILDACTTLMECIKALIKKSKALQDEIVTTGRGNTTVKEFYKRNSQWTEGLISASKSVAKGANLLVEAADKAVTSESNQNFEIIVAAQEIAACTAQLVIASKVKAPKESKKLKDVTKASREVSQATGVVVATVKDCIQKLEKSQEIDLTKLTPSQAKTMEMEIHVKVLELEQALQSERLKLSSFRREHYQNN